MTDNKIVYDSILPKWDDIPSEFKSYTNPWNKLANLWFFLDAHDWKFYPKPGVDVEKAQKCVAACLRSWEVKHEHKAAGVGYLLSQFFERIESDND